VGVVVDVDWTNDYDYDDDDDDDSGYLRRSNGGEIGS
jgi:hypothetical protein